jgi:hypothetical protein
MISVHYSFVASLLSGSCPSFGLAACNKDLCDCCILACSDFSVGWLCSVAYKSYNEWKWKICMYMNVRVAV